MRISRVIGTVTLSRYHPSLQRARLRLAVPLSLAELQRQAGRREAKPVAEPLVVYDELGAGIGSLIALSESREASQPFYPKQKPIDAYCAAILDQVDVCDPRSNPESET